MDFALDVSKHLQQGKGPKSYLQLQIAGSEKYLVEGIYFLLPMNRYIFVQQFYRARVFLYCADDYQNYLLTHLLLNHYYIHAQMEIPLYHLFDNEILKTLMAFVENGGEDSPT